MTIRDALAYGATRLRTRDDLQESAEWDSALLLRHVLKLTRAQLMTWPERLLADGEEIQYQVALARRLLAEPIQYIVGVQEFYGRDFAVAKGVLIPRPETELLVDAVLGFFADRDAALHIVDVGTGSGAIAITLACELPHARIVALDLSTDALAIAAKNAAAHGVADRVAFVASDLLRAVDAGVIFDAVVSNPPYVPMKERHTLHAQVSEYEPAMALFGGEDGFDIYRRLPAEAWRHLREGGPLLMEIGEHGVALDEHLAGWRDVRYTKDLQGLTRVVTARRGERLLA